MVERQRVTGSEALAYGAIDAGVRFVTGYPGSPSTSVVNALVRLAGDLVRIEWGVNEKSAADAALGATIAGWRTLLCVKSVGLNVALDSLMVANLNAGKAGYVILAGDDPGGWGSQNEQDSRPLVEAAEVPMLEPTSVGDARSMMGWAFELSEKHRVPVVVRLTRSLTGETASLAPPEMESVGSRSGSFERREDRTTVLPAQVVGLHEKLLTNMDWIGAEFNPSPFNRERGKGRDGILVAGCATLKLDQLLAESGHPPLQVLQLGTLNPFPEERVTAFVRKLDRVLVLEETAPYVEIRAQAAAQRVGLLRPILGRLSGHVPRAGELFGAEIARALGTFIPDWNWPSPEPTERAFPSLRPLPADCPYVPAFETLLAAMDLRGGRDHFIITGETSCMVRGQLPPLEILDVKYSLGASIGLAAGLARTGSGKRVVALSGDSAFLHSGMLQLIEANQAGVDMMVVILANGVAGISGGQPHAASGKTIGGRAQRPVDLEALVLAAGVDHVCAVDPADREAMLAAYEEGMESKGVVVVIANRLCPVCSARPPR